jgi:hypothetical protein
VLGAAHAPFRRRFQHAAISLIGNHTKGEAQPIFMNERLQCVGLRGLMMLKNGVRSDHRQWQFAP